VKRPHKIHNPALPVLGLRAYQEVLTSDLPVWSFPT
jgi:hypothetical protein